MERLPYPFFVSDIDGTLLDDKRQISEANKNAIASFRKSGGVFTLATGRTYMEAKRFIGELEIQVPVILCNGAAMYDPVSNKQIPVKTFERQMILQLMKEWKKTIPPQVDIFVYGLDRVYGTNIGYVTQASIDEGFEPEIISSFDKLPDIPYLKVVAIAEKEEMKAMLDWSKQRSDAFPLDCILSSDEYFEILPSGISKGNAVLQLLESIHLQAGQAAAIGDHLNDLSMLEIVGLPAAVANAHPLVLQQAAVHVPPHHQDGVKHFIQHHLLPHKAKASL